METINYEKQGIDFLDSTNTSMKVKFYKNGIHFQGDTDHRDIFHITLKNSSHSYTFKFGQSIKYSTGNGGNCPTAYDVLTCLQKYDVGNFENFCDEFGYTTDDPAAAAIARTTYKAVVNEWDNIQKLFTSEQIEQLREIN